MRRTPMTAKKRLLYIYADTMGPNLVPERNPLHALARHFTGDQLLVWHFGDESEARARAAAVEAAIPEFRLHWTRGGVLPPVIRQLQNFLFHLRTGLRLSRRNGRYDLIVAYGPYRTALAAWILSKLTGAPFVVEVPGHPVRSLLFTGGRFARLRAWLGPRLAAFLVRRADHVRLLYPGQLQGWAADVPAERTTVFHEYVPVSTIQREPPGDYVLFIGYPWHLKGVDLLIRAWRTLWRDYPDVKLRIVGYCPNRRPYEELSAGIPTIELCGPVPYHEALSLIAGCKFFVLPSRTEAAPRVLLESMAAGKAAVATRVDGIPHYLEDGVTGLLFEPEDIAGLADCLRRLLDDPELTRRMGNAAHARAHGPLAEEAYADHFNALAERVITRRTARAAVERRAVPAAPAVAPARGSRPGAGEP